MAGVCDVSMQVTLNVVDVIVGGRWAFFKKTADSLVFSRWHNKPLCLCLWPQCWKPLNLGKVDRDLFFFFFFFSLGNSPPSLLSSPTRREKASVGVDTFQWWRVFSVSFTVRRGRAAAICHLSRTCEASRTLKRAGRIVRDPSWPWPTQSVWGASPWQEGAGDQNESAVPQLHLPAPSGGSRSPLATFCTLTRTNIFSFSLF